jgi:hypothetical protein
MQKRRSHQPRQGLMASDFNPAAYEGGKPQLNCAVRQGSDMANTHMTLLGS